MFRELGLNLIPTIGAGLCVNVTNLLRDSAFIEYTAHEWSERAAAIRKSGSLQQK